MSWKRLKNNNFQNRLQLRARIIQLIREFFIKEGFLEVETPILVPAAGQEPYLNPLRTKVWDEQGRTREAYLITSPEYAHKKLLAAGFEKIFEITRAFRAEEHWGGLHNPEFTILEWYRAGADYTTIMRDIERLVQFVWHNFNKQPSHTKSKIKNQKSKILYRNRAINLSSPWQRLTVREAFEKYAEVNLESVKDDDEFFKIFLTKIEPKLGREKPTILYEYPARMAALAKIKNRVAERFELYIAGVELANAFSELTDAAEQRRRFLEEQKLHKKLGKEIIPLDEDFLDAVAHLPPCAGIAFGVDRLVMLLTEANSIEEVLTFPANQLF